MKKLMILLTVCAISMMFVESVLAQATQTQNVTVAVGNVSLISVTGSPAAMNITTGTAGTDALTPVTDNSTKYSITHNAASNLKITAQLNSALTAGYTLSVNLVSGAGKGTSSGTVDISDGTAKSVVTAINKGADASEVITYTFAANASAGALTSTAKGVTLTLTP